MKIDNYIKKIKEEEYVFNLDKNFEGHCPCFDINKTIEGRKLRIHGHCWRSGLNWGDKNKEGCGIHVWSTIPKCRVKFIARALKKRLDEAEWYGNWHIVYETNQ